MHGSEFFEQHSGDVSYLETSNGFGDVIELDFTFDPIPIDQLERMLQSANMFRWGLTHQQRSIDSIPLPDIRLDGTSHEDD